jgi:beta-1,4-mannosyl-glycoprotein beta-1,4-N-acetylglucosaminyltransferase
MRVIDSFIFFNEIELLKLRLHYLNDVVDYFIISESNYTHSGKPKPYYLDEVLSELSEDIRNKIIRLKYEPNITQFNFQKDIEWCDLGNDYWKLERAQRNLITQNLSQFSLTDMFMVSDLDEIPSKETVEEYQNVINENGEMLKNFCAVVKSKLFYYNFKTFQNDNWDGTVISTVGNTLQVGCDYLRYNRGQFYSIEDGGFHFSTFGDVNRIRTKIQSFAHQELNKEQYVSDLNIEKSIQNKEDIYHISGKFKDYDLLDFPEDLRMNIVKFFPEEMYQ